MNPESPTNVVEIRKQVDNFLAGFSYSQYAPFVGMQPDMFSDLNLPPFMQNQLSAFRNPDPYLTGSNTASLPMTFALVSNSGMSKLEFTLLVNPANMNRGKTSTIGAGYSRDGFVTQMWGPNQDLITATGSTAGFMIEGIGLTAVGRRRSFAFLNFISLMATYRNNGYIYNDPTLLQGLTRVIDRMTGIEMSYDGQLYMGHFNNFTLDENADRPFAINFNLEFVTSMLSSNYNEIRGHFASIDDMVKSNMNPPQLIDDVTQQNVPLQVAQASVAPNIKETTYTGGDTITSTNASIPSTGSLTPDMVSQTNLNNFLYGGRMSYSKNETNTIPTPVPINFEGKIGYGGKVTYGGAQRDVGSKMATVENISVTLKGNIGFGGTLQRNDNKRIFILPKNP